MPVKVEHVLDKIIGLPLHKLHIPQSALETAVFLTFSHKPPKSTVVSIQYFLSFISIFLGFESVFYQKSSVFARSKLSLSSVLAQF